jgi:hypothetical protein
MKTLGPREVTSNQVDAILKYFENYFNNQSDTKSCYVYGIGGKSKAAYANLSLMDGVSLRLTHSCLPRSLAFLRFIPSHVGVVQILKPSRLIQVMDNLGDSGMTGIYFFDPKRDEEFIKLIKTKPHPKVVNDWLNNVDEGIFYQFDSINGSSKTGMFDWLKIGDAVSDLIRSDLEGLWKQEL